MLDQKLKEIFKPLEDLSSKLAIAYVFRFPLSDLGMPSQRQIPSALAWFIGIKHWEIPSIPIQNSIDSGEELI